MKNINIVNARGETELFSLKKVYRSVKKAGGSRDLAKKIAQEIGSKVYPGISTAEIFKMVKAGLKKESPKTAIKIDLRESIRRLGPAGFVFEKYMKDVFLAMGFSVEINNFLKGKCVEHEIDLVLNRNKTFYLAECKYRNKAGEKIDVSVCLKAYASFVDIKNGSFKQKEAMPMVITNAKITNQAVKYASCQGVKLLGWNFPKDRGLEKIIEDSRFYPVTILPSFKGYLIDIFACQGLMLAKDILEIDLENFSKTIKIPIGQLKALSREAKLLFNS